MKIFILCFVICLAHCNVITEFEDAIEDAFDDVKNSKFVTGLREALELPESKYIDVIEDDIRSYVLNLVKDHFRTAIEEAASIINDAGATVQDAHKRIAEFERDLKEIGSEGFEKTLIAEELEKLVSKILGQDGSRLPAAVRNALKKILDPQRLESELIQKLTSSKVAQDIRRYIEEFGDDIEKDVDFPIKRLLAVLTDSEIQEMIRYMLSPRHARSIADIFKKIGDFFTKLGLKIKEKFSGFAAWARTNWNSAIQKVKDLAGPATALAKEFLGHAKDMALGVAKQALEYFKANKEKIGKILFEKVTQLAAQLIAKKG